MIQIDPDRCTRCHACVRDCVVHILRPGADGIPSVRREEERYCLNCQHCLAVCPSGAVVCHGVAAKDAPPTTPLPSAEAMMALLRQRRSCRQFRPEPLDETTLRRFTEALAYTPTGCNDHRLWFALVHSPSEMEFFRAEMLRRLQWFIRTGLMRLAYPNFGRSIAAVLGGAGVVFRGAPNFLVAATPKNAPCREADPWIALSYLDLLAQACGVGTCWSGFALHAFRWAGALRRRLGVPDGYRVGAVLLLGRPAVQYARPTAPRPFPMRVL